jgi:hypothetical protein
MIPLFEPDGTLPPGIHWADWEEIVGELLDFTPRGRAAQKARYGGDLFPVRRSEMRGVKSLLTFFQIDRDGTAKGIIALDLRALP